MDRLPPPVSFEARLTARFCLSRDATMLRIQSIAVRTRLLHASCVGLIVGSSMVGCQSWLGGQTPPAIAILPIEGVVTGASPMASKAAATGNSAGKNALALHDQSSDTPSGVVQASAVGYAPAAGYAPEVPLGATYLMPGELSCSTNQIPVYETIFMPPNMVYGIPSMGNGAMGSGPMAGQPFAAPPQADPNQPGRAGWLDVLPQEGGPISPDFGLPREAEVSNRVPNPLYIQTKNPEATWEALAAELTNYFPIQTEQRIEQSAGVLTEGRFETPWQVGSTVLEPWRNDSVGSFNRWQSTLQTTRSKAIVRVIPAAGGYEIDVRVDKQLEDLSRPERASAGAASFGSDSALKTDRLTPIDRIQSTDRWISIGRDEPIEQEMLRRFRARLTGE